MIKRKQKSQNPLRIVFIRHGESESNVVQRSQMRGEIFKFEKEINSRVDWKQRLSPKGVAESEIASKELKKIYGGLEFFEKKYVSPFIRARETALRISGDKDFLWRIDDRISERIWGIYGLVSRAEQKSRFPMTAKLANNDPWYIRYDGGESLFDVYNRFKTFRMKLSQTSVGKNVLIVAHKQLIQAACYDIEKKLPEDWDNIYEGRQYDIPNLGLVEYSRVNPENPRDIRDGFTWRRIIHLADRSSSNFLEEWKEFTADKNYLNSEMKEQIEKYPEIIKK